MMKKKLLTLFLAAALVVNSQGILYASAGQQGSAPEMESEEIQEESQEETQEENREEARMEETQTGEVQTEEIPAEKVQTEETQEQEGQAVLSESSGDADEVSESETGNGEGKTESEAETGVEADIEEESDSEADAGIEVETPSETEETGAAEEEETVPEEEAGKKEEAVSETKERTEMESDAETAVQSESSESDTAGTIENTDQGTWDTTQPVIEEIIFPQKDTTLKVGDTLQFQVRAYDADSGIKEVTAWVWFIYNDHRNENIPITFHQTEEENLYESDPYVIEETFVEGYLSSLDVTDNAGNTAQGQTGPDFPGGEDKYPFQGEGPAPDEEVPTVVYKVEDLQFNMQGQQVREGTTGEISLLLDRDFEEGTIYCNFQNEGFMQSSGISLTKNEMNGRYEVSVDLPTDCVGIWKLSLGSDVSDQEANVVFDMGDQEFWYEVTEEGVSKIPEITAIQLEQQGQKVQVGNSITLKVAVESEKPLLETGFAYFANEDLNVTVESESREVELRYDEEQGMYVGNLEVTEDMYPCEWYVSSIYITDEEGRNAKIEAFNSDFYETYPYYFYVQNKDTSVTSGNYSASVTLHMLDENLQWVECDSYSRSDAPRRVTLGQMGLDFNHMPSVPEYDENFGIEFEGWVDADGNPVDENTECLVRFNGENIGVYNH